MSFFRTVDPADAAIHEGKASLGAIANAARDVALYADNVNAELYARTEAFDEAIKAVREATGIELENPQLKPSGDPVQGMYPREDPFQQWDRRIGEISVQHPDQVDALAGLDLAGIERATRGKAQAADKRLSVLSSTRGASGFAASLYGGIKGAFRDPVTYLTLPIGLGAGGARTVGGKILSTAWREALVSGATETALQPVVQKWRAEAGLSAGLNEALKNIGMATAVGGILGAGIRGGIEAPGAVRRQLARRADRRLKAPPAEQIADDLRPLRDDLPPAARAAVDVIDQDTAVMRSVRAELGDELSPEFGRLMQRSDRFAERLDFSDGEDFATFLRSQELTHDPDLAGRFDTAREAMETAQAALEALQNPLNARTLADTLEELDPDSAARVRAIEEELAGTVPAKRRADLEAERAQIAESIGEDVLSRTEREFRIGPEKAVKRARKKAREARKAFGAVRREVDAKANARLEASRAGQPSVRAAGSVQPEGQTGAPGAAIAPAQLVDADPFEVGGAEFSDQVAGLENQIDPDAELADLLFVDDAGKVTVGGRTVGEALEEADRGTFLSQLVEACRPA